MTSIKITLTAELTDEMLKAFQIDDEEYAKEKIKSMIGTAYFYGLYEYSYLLNNAKVKTDEIQSKIVRNNIAISLGKQFDNNIDIEIIS